MSTVSAISAKSLRVEPHVSWRLLLTVHAVLIREVDQALREAGQIPFEAYDVLITLKEAPDGRMRMSDLAEATLLSHSGISRSVARLALQGLLVREQSEQDGRVFYAVLTPAGRTALEEAWPVYREVIEKRYIQFCHDGTATRMNRFLGRVLEDYDVGRFAPIVAEKRIDAP